MRARLVDSMRSDVKKRTGDEGDVTIKLTNLPLAHHITRDLGILNDRGHMPKDMFISMVSNDRR